MRNLDELAAELTKVTTAATQHAITRTQTRAVVNAAASGGEDAARRLAAGMSTEHLQRAVNHLKG
ncbi:hypothetical protein [Streptomyces scopuliridis]|uniref:hypothetical protein n=1 Tax=Streptomyces scopuliridis TaxID=452529 RepID=UPI003445FFE5